MHTVAYELIVQLSQRVHLLYTDCTHATGRQAGRQGVGHRGTDSSSLYCTLQTNSSLYYTFQTSSMSSWE